MTPDGEPPTPDEVPTRPDRNRGGGPASPTLVAQLPVVLVVGGTGYFGTLLIRELLEFTTGRIVIGGRDLRRLRRARRRIDSRVRERVSVEVVELNNVRSVDRAVAGAAVAICAAGPFQTLPGTLLSSCLAHGVHYIDLADDRDFVNRARRMVGDHSPAGKLPVVCTGFSTIPALSGILAGILAKKFDAVESIETQLAPGNRAPRSRGTVASLLSSVGRPFDIWREGSRQTVIGWSEPRAFDFPPPVGTRTGFLVNAPDYDIFPETFGTQCVTFRVGSELRFLNGMVSGLAWLTRRRVVSDWPRWSGALYRAMGSLGILGHDHGALGVKVCGQRKGIRVAAQACIVADHHGTRVPVMPAVIMVEALLANRIATEGLMPVDSWLTREQLELECNRRSLRLIVQDLQE
ncbi:MAG: saccharopine dehydrogenase NADP-binding domain-containing protein [Planctomycetes bacterium]|nr:saccharopine dehydrogenase NADP-binding domain-containing protein [Planctomycetota bacterium]